MASDPDTVSPSEIEEVDLTQDITFYNRPEDERAIGSEKLACTVSSNGDWRLFKMREGVPLQKGLGKEVGKSWITLAFPPESLPLPISTRRTIALNVFRGRKLSKESAIRRKELELYGNTNNGKNKC